MVQVFTGFRTLTVRFLSWLVAGTVFKGARRQENKLQLELPFMVSVLYFRYYYYI